MTFPNLLRLLFPGALALAASVGLLTSSCDVIDNPNPPKTTVSAGRRDTVALDSAETRWLAQPGHATPRQRVLLEDFTGHTCGNCPRANEVAHQLEQQYGDTLVVIAAHVGYFADTTKPGYHYDFRTPAGDELNTVFGVADLGLPQGMVSRIKPAGAAQPVVSRGAWPTMIAAEAARAPQQQLIVTALTDENRQNVRVKLTTKYLVAQPGRTYRVVLNYVEDTLTRKQKDYALPAPSDIPNYLHRHIMRDSPLTTFGNLSAVSPTAGQTISTYLLYPLPDQPWARRPAHLVAYLLDATDPEAKQWRVVQVAETKL